MNRRHVLWACGIVFLIFVASLLFRSDPIEARKDRRSSSLTEPDSPVAAATGTAPLPADSPAGMLAEVFRKLRAGELRTGELDALRRAVLDAPRRDAIAAILKFLKTGQDALTGEAFTVGSHGELAAAPTFRVMLLDLLGRLCRETKSGEALAYSRALLQNKTSADEWAIALRNVGWGAPGDTQYLAGKAAELLRHEPWRRQPTAGYFEAFDVIVYARAVNLIPDLSAMLQEEDNSLQTSAAVALDRMAEMAPLEAMSFLNTNRAELSHKPFLRADYFGKADLSQPAQRAAVETYLARPDVQIGEKAKMLAVLASPGSFASDNLLTQPPPDEFPPERIAALQRTVDEWLRAQRFPELTTAIVQLQRRIAP